MENRLIDGKRGALPLEDALHNVTCIVKFLAGSPPQDGQQDADELWGRQQVLDVVIDALETLGARAHKAQRPVSAVA